MHELIGKSQTQICKMDAARAQSLHASLGLSSPMPEIGDVLQPFWHQIYFWDTLPADQLGRDGHPKIGGFIPDLGLPRRMWAGGRLQFHADLRTSAEATKVTTIESISEKKGKSGPLAFVTLRHEISQFGKLCITEHQDLVYRQDVDPLAPAPKVIKAKIDETYAESRSFSSTLLFRYSALTMNGHRIHYDENYSRDIEGYTGLVVHGPLLAQYLMLLGARELGLLKTFSFRATSPLMHTEIAEFCLKGNNMWVRARDGRQCMQATVNNPAYCS